MNLIEKVVIKDGVNSDTEVTINLYSGQVAEINAILATISNTRGVASYNTNTGKPQFLWSGVGANEMWVYIDGLGFSTDSLATIAADTSIKILPSTPGGTYTYTIADNGKLLIITDASSITSIDANAILDGQSFLVLNNRTDSEVNIYASGDTFMFTNDLSRKSLSNYYKSGGDIYSNIIKDKSTLFKNTGYYNSQVVNLVDIEEFQQPLIELGYNGAKTLNIPVGWPVGKELMIANAASSGSATVNLPSGDTFYNGTTNLSLSIGQIISLVKGSAGIWYLY